MWKRFSPYLIIAFVVIFSTLVLWSPFLFRWGSFLWLNLGHRLNMLDLYKHWDGVLYIVVAKTGYFFSDAFSKKDLLSLNPAYFAAHFPLYPFLIWLTSPVFGFLKGMLFWPIVFAVLYGWALYFFLKTQTLTKKPLLLTIVALFFTPRFFVVRSVGAPETIFLFFLVLSVFNFMEKKYLLAGLFGAFATLTKSPGILLIIAYGLYFLEQFLKIKKIYWSWFLVGLIPLSLLGLFFFYQKQYQDFFAYFHSGDNIHLLFPPFQVFMSQAKWVGTGWLEDLYFIFVFYGLALVTLWKEEKMRPIFYFLLVFFGSIISVQHKDLARYSLPMLPFALIAYEKFFTSKKVLLVLTLLLPALYFYALNFMIYNIAPVTDWSTFR